MSDQQIFTFLISLLFLVGGCGMAFIYKTTKVEYISIAFIFASVSCIIAGVLFLFLCLIGG